MRYAGIDEAGYGPTLGPLAIGAVAVDTDDIAGLDRALGAHGVKDSKALHKAGNLAPLETVALGGLAWVTGRQPKTASDVFAALGEKEKTRQAPWQAGANELRLPLAAHMIHPWSIPSAKPVGVHGQLIHADAYNDFISTQGNKADLEIHHIQGLLAWAGGNGPSEMVVDRLGGRRYYADALRAIWPSLSLDVGQEIADASRYCVGSHQVSFLVGAESRWPLTALASCFAKYARELHMTLFNRYWCKEIVGLKPTAGYPEDARRFLKALTSARYEPIGTQLIRGWPRF
jgi:ribonuclease HII